MQAFRSAAFRILPGITGCLPTGLLARMTGRKPLFPFYHAVSDEPLPHIEHLYDIRSTKKFREDIDFLLKHFRPMLTDELLAHARNGSPLPKGSFFLSFDDGLREFHDVVAPVLLEKGVPAVCFLNSAFIDNRGLFYRYKASLLAGRILEKAPAASESSAVARLLQKNGVGSGSDLYHGILSVKYPERSLLNEIAGIMEFDFSRFLARNKPYLTSEQVNSLIGKGFLFGSHSIDHPEYFRIPEEEQIRQTKVSIDDICSRFSLDYRLFSFPFTDDGVKMNFFNRIFEGKEPIAGLTFGGAGLKKDSAVRNIQRIPMEETTLPARRIIHTEYLYYLAKESVRKNVVQR
jgi:peptidoglycan/xylan/chitin deacetylase (PgdA/CDA1 family)